MEVHVNKGIAHLRDVLVYTPSGPDGPIRQDLAPIQQSAVQR